MISFIDLFDHLKQRPILFVGKEIRPFRDQVFRNFSTVHNSSSMAQIVFFSVQVFHNLCVLMVIRFFCDLIQRIFPLFLYFKSPILRLIFGHDLNIEDLCYGSQYSSRCVRAKPCHNPKHRPTPRSNRL